MAEAAINRGLNVNKRPRGNTYPIQCAVESGDFDSCLNIICLKDKKKYQTLLSSLQKGDSRDILADRLILWLGWEGFMPALLSEDYNSPETLILRTLDRVFGIACRGEPRIVEILVQNGVHLPSDIDTFLNAQVSVINDRPSALPGKMEIHPNVLDIIFSALPSIKKEYVEESWIMTILSALSKKHLPFTLDNVKSELGNIFLQKSIPNFFHLQILKGSSWLTTES